MDGSPNTSQLSIATVEWESNIKDNVTTNVQTNTTTAQTTAATTTILIEITLMLLIFIFGTLGNSIVVFIVCKKRRMQSFTNWLIFNLSVADLVGSIICLPMEIPILLNGNKWLYEPFLCPIIYPIQTMAIYGSVLTLVILSFSRYWAVLHPFRSQPSVALAKIQIFVIWILSLICVVPYATSLTVQDGYCKETWTEKQNNIYTITVFILQFVLPLSIIAVTYIMIALELKSSERKSSLPFGEVKVRENRKVLRMLLVVTVTFLVCLLPYHVVYLILLFAPKNSLPHYYHIFTSSSYLLLYANGALNPLIYNMFNSSFREAFAELFRSVKSYIRKSSIRGAYHSTRTKQIENQAMLM